MSILDELVTNRTTSDVAWVNQMARKGLAGRTAEENAQWLRGYASEELITEDGYTIELQNDGALILRSGYLRGAYNYIDLNRVESAVKDACAKAIATVDINPPAMPVTKTDWTQEDVPSRADAARYLENLAYLKELLETLGVHDFDPRGYFDEDWPEAPESLDRLDHIGANRIETLLAELYKGALWLNAVLRYGDTHAPRTWTQVEAAFPTWNDIEGTRWPYVSYGEDFIEGIPQLW